MKQHHRTNSIFFLAALVLALSLLLQLPAGSVARAADVTVKAELNATEFPLDQAVLLTITVSGTRTADPTMPEADGLRFAYRGQNSQTQWINGNISSSVSFVFMVQAEQAGSHTIKPIKVTVDGKVHLTDPITCTVLPASGAKAPPAGGQAIQPRQGNAPSTRLRSGEAEKIGFMRIIPARDNVYSGQLIPCTIKAYFRQGMRVTLKSSPRFVGENFILQSIDDKPQQQEELINGEPYTALTWQGTLSAVKVGTFPLEVEMDADLLVREQRRQNNLLGVPFLHDPFFDDFFAQYSHREVKVASPKKSITVMDLPAAGRPDDFHGAIGTFSLAVAASPLQGKIGDPITLKMMVSGTGNFDMVHAPALTDKEGWKTYPATDSVEKQKRGRGKKTFEQAIVPTSPELTTIPPVQFSYFDPEAGEYVSLVSDPISIELEKAAGITAGMNRPGDKKPTPAPPGTAERPQPNSLAPLHPDPGRLVQAIRPLYQTRWFLLLLTAALLCLTASLLLYRRRKKLAADPTILLHKRLNQQLNHHYREMEQAIRAGDQDSFCSHCRTAIQLRLAEIWGLEARAITLADLQQRLPADAPLLDIFSRIEHAGYSGNSLEQDRLEEMLQTTRKELERLP
jgi:hypothetical protein